MGWDRCTSFVVSASSALRLAGRFCRFVRHRRRSPPRQQHPFCGLRGIKSVSAVTTLPMVCVCGVRGGRAEMSLKACLAACTAVRPRFWMVATFALLVTQNGHNGRYLCGFKAFSAFLPSPPVHFCRMRLASRSVLPPSVAVPYFFSSRFWLPSRASDRPGFGSVLVPLVCVVRRVVGGGGFT